MKKYNLYILSLLSFMLLGCPDSDQGEIISNFEPVTLELSHLNVKTEDTYFLVNGFSFKCKRAESVENISSTYNGENIAFDGIALWYPDQDSNPSYVELDLKNITGISKITVRVYNNGTTTPVTLYNNENIIEEVQAAYRVTDIIFEVSDKVFDKLRISSFEGAVISIKLE